MNWTCGTSPKDVLHLTRHRASSEDVRADVRVSEALIRANLFRGGLRLELNSVTVLQNAEVSTVQYRLTLHNDDRDVLYVCDPDRMGSELFHYYTNGVVFGRENQPSIWSQHKTVTPPSPHDSWQPSWFTRIESGQSLQRAVTLRGYPSIPKGRYSCQLTYSGPQKVERSQRNLSDGRYWIGEIESNAIAVVVN